MRSGYQLQVAHGPAKIGGEHRVQLRAQYRVGKHAARGGSGEREVVEDLRRHRRIELLAQVQPARYFACAFQSLGPALAVPAQPQRHPVAAQLEAGRVVVDAVEPLRACAPTRVCRIEGRRPSLRASSAPIDSLSSISALDVLSLLPSV